MKDEQLQTAVLERQVLHAIMDDSSRIFEEDIFVSEVAKEFHYILLSLVDENKALLPEHIIMKSVEYVDAEVIIAVQSTQYQDDLFDEYKKKLYMRSVIIETRNGLLDILNDNNKDDTEKFLEVEQAFEQSKEKIEVGDSRYLSFSELIKRHKQTIEKRAKHMRISTGCYNFDKIMPNPTAGIVIIAGFSGSTKSTLCHYLIKQRIAKRFYTTYFNTELAMDGVMDSIMPSIVKVPYMDILGLDDDDEHIDYGDILTKYNDAIKHFQNQKNFRMYPYSSVSLKEMRKFNLKARKDFKMKPDDLLISFVDLVSMVEEFASEGKTTRADMISQALNVLNGYALKDNTLYIATVQLKRMPQKISVEKEEDLEKFRPDLAMIKDSGTYEERARMVIGIHNPYHIVRKVNCNKIVKDLTEPLIELQVLKDTYTGKTGNIIKYYFDSEYKVYVPYVEKSKDNSVESTEDGNGDIRPYQMNTGGQDNEESSAN